jgi:hypothetical protein
MNRLTRMLTMTGMGVFAAVSVGAAPAMATTGSTQAPAQGASSAAKTTTTAPARSRIIDIYSSRTSCHYAGRLGERRGAWDDYDCYRVRGGYALRVSFDSWSDWNNWDDDDWNGPWGIRGHRNHFRGNDFRGGHRFNNHRGNRHRFPSNGVGARPARPGQVPPIGTPSPS